MAVNMKAVAPSTATSGELITVGATTLGTANLIHTAQVGTGDNNNDEIWMYAVNTANVDVELSLLWDGKLIPVNVPARQGFTLIIPGMRINNAKQIKAFAGTTNVINVKCDVNRIVVEADA